MKSFFRYMGRSRFLRPQWTLGILALIGCLTGPPALQTLLEVSLELAQISLSLCQMGLVLLRVWGI
jgi:hypothetical protein